jgi:folate-binding protein YgfZ
MQTNGEQAPLMQSSPQPEELAAIRISGQDRIDFLQGQLTQDMKRLTADYPLLAGWVSPKGRLLCVLWVAEWQNTLWLVLPRELAEVIAKRLKMFVLRANVQVEMAEARVQPAEQKQLRALYNIKEDTDISHINHCFYNENEFCIFPAGITEMGIRVQPGSYGDGENKTRLLPWRLANIRAGLPAIWQTTTGEFVPQMVNLDLLDAISFTKGCYVGQEIVARTQNLGRIKRRMYAFNTATNPSSEVTPGQPVYGDDGVVGQIVDAAVTETGVELLAVIRIDSLEQNLSLEPDGTYPLVKQSLPYTIP